MILRRIVARKTVIQVAVVHFHMRPIVRRVAVGALTSVVIYFDMTGDTVRIVCVVKGVILPGVCGMAVAARARVVPCRR